MTIKKADMRERVRKGFLNISMDTIEQQELFQCLLFCRMYAFDATLRLEDVEWRGEERERVCV